jgi:hypothetical protein
MEHERGAFKVNPAPIAGAVKKARGTRGLRGWRNARERRQTAKFRAINLAELVSLLKK